MPKIKFTLISTKDALIAFGPIALMSAKRTNNVLEFLEDQLKDLEGMRYEVCDKSDSPLQNIIDEIVTLYLSTIYKIKFLA